MKKNSRNGETSNKMCHISLLWRALLIREKHLLLNHLILQSLGSQLHFKLLISFSFYLTYLLLAYLDFLSSLDVASPSLDLFWLDLTHNALIFCFSLYFCPSLFPTVNYWRLTTGPI